MNNSYISPFVKWAGGKTALLPKLTRRFPARFDTYFEPFLGGGAAFFALQPHSALLSDSNPELINAYKVVQSDVESLIRLLHSLEREFHHAPKSTFLRTRRAYVPGTRAGAEQAARFLFLNRTCYNGLYRVNRSGIFNVPFGRYSRPTICDEEALRLASDALRNAVLRARDYSEVLRLVERDDFVYLDPPYHPVSDTANFVNYTADPFDEKKHVGLAYEVAKLSEGVGCKILISSSNVSHIRETYRRLGFKIEYVASSRRISCRPETRGKVRELLIRNFN